MNEIWKDIEGYEGLYRISDMGRVKSLYSNKEKILKQRKDREGYLNIGLCNKGLKIFRVHRLVSIAFIDNKYLKPVVNHINGIKSDNRKENLEWNTIRENEDHALRTNLKNYTGQGNPNAKLNDKQVRVIKFIKLIGKMKLSETAKIFNVSNTSISEIWSGKTWGKVLI